MAPRKTSKDSLSLKSFQDSLLSAKFNGALLVTISALTLLSLMSGNQGRLTSLWIDLLQRGFGAAIWGIPFVLGFLGFWIIIRSVEHMPEMEWQKPWGFLLLFICSVVAMTLAPGDLFLETARLFSPLTDSAGGWVGRLLGEQLQVLLGPHGAWLVLTVLTVTSLYMLQKSLVLRGLAVVQQALLGFWELLGRVPQGDYRLKPWPETRVYQVYIWLRSKKVDFGPWRKRYRGWEQQYITILQRLRNSRPRYEDPPQPPPAQPIAAAQVPAPTPLNVPTGAATTRQPVIGDVKVADYWQLPVLEQMLEDHERIAESDEHVRQTGVLLQETLGLFGVPATFEGAYKGPSVTQYLIKPGYIQRLDNKGRPHRTKVKVSKITSLSNDLALAVAAQSVRIEAPIPGTSYVGIEISNTRSNSVSLKELFLSEQFQSMDADLPLALGEDVKGQPIVADLAKMPHLLIAGATGTGKSVCINAIISTLLLSHSPDTLRLLMVDPKMVELSEYNDIPHLIKKVVIDVEEAEQALDWGVQEMDKRYHMLNRAKCRDIKRFNARRKAQGERPLPYIVVVIDEMADLMMMAPQEVERSICRLAQMARAVGIHLIIATQRPSVDVITGLIKANFPARIAFAVSSQTDSRVIIDGPGAERLLGQGDMLFVSPDATRSGRVQGTWVSDMEIHRVVEYWKIAKEQKEQVHAAQAAVQEWLVQREIPNSDKGAEFNANPSGSLVSEQELESRPVSKVGVPEFEESVHHIAPKSMAKKPVPILPWAGDAKLAASKIAETDLPHLATKEKQESEAAVTLEKAPATVPVATEETLVSKPLPEFMAEAKAEESLVSAEDRAVGLPAPDEVLPDLATAPVAVPGKGDDAPPISQKEDFYQKALNIAESGTILSVSVLQRRLKIGRNKALALIDQMLDTGKFDEESLDSQTFMALVRYRDARR